MNYIYLQQVLLLKYLFTAVCNLMRYILVDKNASPQEVSVPHRVEIRYMSDADVSGTAIDTLMRSLY
ncbi:MAG: hypothetical protein QNJ49_14820 [Mastigocoleus sp. MO_167.B18]|nr:hypothetical protein [Mastigocoleus sp. MO_167.B18]